MNYEFFENAIKAKRYGEAAVKSLIPDDIKKHFDVIENEVTDMTIEFLQKHKKNLSADNQNVGWMKHGSCKTEEKSDKGNVKKVTID